MFALGARRAFVALVAAVAIGCSEAEPVEVEPDPSRTPALEVAVVEDLGTRRLVVTSGEAVTALTVLVADTAGERAAGLRGVTRFDSFDGMLFVYDSDATTGFTMREVSIPLRIGWFDEDGALVGSVDMEPCMAPPEGQDCPIYAAPDAYRYALEVPESTDVDFDAVTRIEP